MDIDKLRAALVDRRGRWGEIAESANVSRKTLWRIASQPDYMPNLQTFVDLERALKIAATPEPAERTA